MGSALATAVQSVPAAAVAPASAAARAVHCALLGIRNRSRIPPFCACSNILHLFSGYSYCLAIYFSLFFFL